VFVPIFFFDLRILITSLVSSNSSSTYNQIQMEVNVMD
jgi:hypothetical protein